jgi:hypothetical protein
MNTFANGLYLFNFRWQNCSLFGGNLQPTNKYALLEAEINKLSPEHVDSLAVSDVTELF